MKKAVFLDRDGVINRDFGYTSHPDNFEFLDGVFEACRNFIAQGYILVVVTNQSGIARGYYTEVDFKHLTEWMLGEFDTHLVDITKVYYCPHHPTAGNGEYRQRCECRKPAPGMLLRAAEELDIDLSQSVIIGDNLTDLQAGERAGVKQGILIDEDGKHSKLAATTQIFSSLAKVKL